MAALHIGGYEWLDWSFRPDVILLCILLVGAYYIAVTQPR